MNLAVMIYLGVGVAGAQSPEGYSEHAAQPGPTLSVTKEEAPAAALESGTKAVLPSTNSRDFIVLGYIQNQDPRWSYHWQSLTHIALPFTDFNSSGALTNLSSSITNRSTLFKVGGIADRHGVKVLMTLRNSGFSTEILDTVMQNPTLRNNLATTVANIVNSTSDNLAGVNLDFEPHPYGTATANGIVDFVIALKARLNPGKTLSNYIGPRYSASNYPRLAEMGASLDFANISCYPWAGSFSTLARSITPYSSYRNEVDAFIANGIPAHKMVLTLGSYGSRWNTTIPTQDEADGYSSSITSNVGSHGFADAKFDTTYAVPRRNRRYQTGAESPWYSYQISGESFRTVVYEDEQGVEFKMRGVLGWASSEAEAEGRRLGGVGFWSLAWMTANFIQTSPTYSSWDMETNVQSNKHRTYPHLYQSMQEVFKAPGQSAFVLEKWEYDSTAVTTTLRNQWDRWRDPMEGNDKIGVTAATRSIVAKPTTANAPANSDYCLRLDVTMSATASNRLFYRWEILGDRVNTTVADRNATRGFFSAASEVQVHVYTPAVYTGRSIAPIFMDANGELERGAPVSLAASGWRQLSWNLLDQSFTPFLTTFKQYRSGNGVLASAGSGAKDISLIGFEITGGGTAWSGSVYLDELTYRAATQGGRRYLINEFAYQGNNGEFVEIHGTPGTIPAGTQLVAYEGTNDSLVNVYNLGGLVIPASGILAVGDPGVTGTSATAGFSAIVEDLFDSAPAALQIRNLQTGEIFDSAVYRAMGGLDRLVRAETFAVTGNGYPWIGQVSTGSGPAGVYTIGRYPDGANTRINYTDFTVMPRTVGASNGGFIPANTETLLNFSTIPAYCFQTFQPFSTVATPPAPIPAPPNGGPVYRCVDTSGGGVIGFIGDASLGSTGLPIEVTGDIYIPGASEPAQAIGIGFCGTQGSTFFPSITAGSGYENGYWITYENRSGVGLTNGLPEAAGVFQFQMANNTNMRSERVDLLGSKSLAEVSLTAGRWTTFRLRVDPTANQLRAEINGAVVYTGAIPNGGPTRGAVQVGFRENHSGNPASSEGTWIDNLRIIHGTPAPEFRDWSWLFY